jgi:hypothetical protein
MLREHQAELITPRAANLEDTWVNRILRKT